MCFPKLGDVNVLLRLTRTEINMKRAWRKGLETECCVERLVMDS